MYTHCGNQGKLVEESVPDVDVILPSLPVHSIVMKGSTLYIIEKSLFELMFPITASCSIIVQTSIFRRFLNLRGSILRKSTAALVSTGCSAPNHMNSSAPVPTPFWLLIKVYGQQLPFNIQGLDDSLFKMTVSSTRLDLQLFSSVGWSFIPLQHKKSCWYRSQWLCNQSHMHQVGAWLAAANTLGFLSFDTCAILRLLQCQCFVLQQKSILYMCMSYNRAPSFKPSLFYGHSISKTKLMFSLFHEPSLCNFLYLEEYVWRFFGLHHHSRTTLFIFKMLICRRPYIIPHSSRELR